MKAVCRTGYSNPFQALIKSICYPDEFCFKSKATTWGVPMKKQPESTIIIDYIKKNHHNFILLDSA